MSKYKTMTDFLMANQKFIKDEKIIELSPDGNSLTRKLGAKTAATYDWYFGSLLKKVFIIRLFGFELSLFRKVKNA